MKKAKIVLITLISLSILSLFILYLNTGKLIDGKLICNEEQQDIIKNMLIEYYNANIKEDLNFLHFSELTNIISDSTTILTIREEFDFNNQFYDIEYKLNNSNITKKYCLEADHFPELKNYIIENDSYKDYNSKIRLTYKILIIVIIASSILLYIVFHIAD